MKYSPSSTHHTIAVMIPCLNEEITIAKVVRDFRAALPEADIHVFDNDSSDRTRDEALAAGATVHFVAQRGKGNVVRAMFRSVDADVAVMVDGDDSYPASQVRELLSPVLDGRAEMAIGTRLQGHDAGAFRPLHMFGNKLVLVASNVAFGTRSTDMLSGYRAFSRQFMKSMPVLSRGFEIETELTLHAADHALSTVEVPIRYGTRPEGSSSKLNTLRDGYRVLRTILVLFKDWRPLAFFGCIAAFAAFVSLLLGIGVVREFLQYERVVGVARAVACVTALLIALLSLTTGLVLDTVNRRTRELHLLLSGLLNERSR
jgi:glycosyltransferase involved in cell wall biosynthesis